MRRASVGLIVPPDEGVDDPASFGGDVDEHECRASAGFVWCESSATCVRSWETPCAVLLGGVSEEEEEEEVEEESAAPSAAPTSAPGGKATGRNPHVFHRKFLNLTTLTAAATAVLLCLVWSSIFCCRPRPPEKLRMPFGEDESLSPWRWDADDEEDAEWDSHWAGVLERVEYEVASTPRRNTELEMV